MIGLIPAILYNSVNFFGSGAKVGTSTKSILFIEATGLFLIAKKDDSNVLF